MERAIQKDQIKISPYQVVMLAEMRPGGSRWVKGRISEINIFLSRRGTSQKEISAELDLHKSTVSLLLSGKIVLEKRLDQIAGLLGISRKKLDSLIERSRGNGGGEDLNETTERRLKR